MSARGILLSMPRGRISFFMPQNYIMLLLRYSVKRIAQASFEVGGGRGRGVGCEVGSSGK